MTQGREIAWSLALSEPSIISVTFGVGGNIDFRLYGNGEYFDIGIAGRFLYFDPDPRWIDPNEAGPEDLVELVSLRGETVLACEAQVNGELVLQTHRVTLNVPPDNEGESWQIVGLQGEFVVALSGGEVAVWEK